jgi:hypothetical protein
MLGILILILILVVCIGFNRKRYFGGGRDALMPRKVREAISSISLADSLPPESLDIYSGAGTSVSLESIRPERRMEYRSTDKMLKMSLHLGQLKLFLSELQFMTRCLADKNAKGYCIYAGSSPSHKGFFFSELFPNIKFIFIDPHEHYLLDGDADQYSPKNIERILYFMAAEGNRYGLKGR